MTAHSSIPKIHGTQPLTHSLGACLPACLPAAPKVRTEAVPLLRKVFWGGGSVALATSRDNFHVLKCKVSGVGGSWGRQASIVSAACAPFELMHMALYRGAQPLWIWRWTAQRLQQGLATPVEER
jgi:hypothetical protein